MKREEKETCKMKDKFKRREEMTERRREEKRGAKRR